MYRIVIFVPWNKSSIYCLAANTIEFMHFVNFRILIIMVEKKKPWQNFKTCHLDIECEK